MLLTLFWHFNLSLGQRRNLRMEWHKIGIFSRNVFGVKSSISRKDHVSVLINKMNDSTNDQNRTYKSNFS